MVEVFLLTEAGAGYTRHTNVAQDIFLLEVNRRNHRDVRYAIGR